MWSSEVAKRGVSYMLRKLSNLIIYMLYIHEGRCACMLAIRNNELDVRHDDDAVIGGC
jgi:hypothetical protein